MAMQVGFSKIFMLVGIGAAGTLFSSGKLSVLLGELKNLVEGYEGKKGDEADGDYSDALAGQIRRLVTEVRQMASARQINVLNGGSSVDVTSLVVPAAALGTVGYGYMWWKGLSVSDLMYVTRHNITNAVSNMKNHLDQVTDAIASTRKHLTQRMEKLDGKVDEQVEFSKTVKDEVTDVRGNLSELGYTLDSLKALVEGMDGKIMFLEGKQEFARRGVQYLCNTVDKNMISGKTQDQFMVAGKSFGGYLTSGGIDSEGVKEISDILDSGDVDKQPAKGLSEKCISGAKYQPRMLTRRNMIKMNINV